MLKKNLIKFKLDNYPLILMTIFLSSENKPSPLIGWLTGILRFCNGQISHVKFCLVPLEILAMKPYLRLVITTLQVFKNSLHFET